MALQASYREMNLLVDDLDTDNLSYFKYCSAGNFHLQRCEDCALLRYPPGPSCPWCRSPRSRWVPVAGEGAVHSFTEVHHAIQPGFRAASPYTVLIVDLDEQRGKPTEHEALRVVGNLVTPEGALAPADEAARVGIGVRVRMTFTQVGPGFSIPNWMLSDRSGAPAGWRPRL